MTKNTKKTDLSPDVLEKLQKTQIEILTEIAKICDKYQLRYCLFFGTLIGAIRHKGFIPWDDDLDIIMPRDDYEVFMKVAPNELGSKYYLQNTETEADYWLNFAKVRKNNTLFEEPSLVNMPDTVHKGIFVDIFPFDYAKKNKGLFIHLKFIIAKIINETMNYKAGIYTTRNSMNYYHMVMLLKKFSYRTLAYWQKKVVKITSKKNMHYLVHYNTPAHYLEAIFPAEYFFPEQPCLFAGHEFMIPKEYDPLLKQIYGNYMILPKEEDRVNHKTLRIIFDTEKNGDN